MARVQTGKNISIEDHVQTGKNISSPVQHPHQPKNPNLNPSVREAFTREAAHTQDTEVPEEIRKRDLWKKEVVKKAKFHYNYRYLEPIVEVQPEPPPEKMFWNAWIAKEQPVPEVTPSPPRETQKRGKGVRQQPQEAVQESAQTGSLITLCSPLATCKDWVGLVRGLEGRWRSWRGVGPHVSLLTLFFLSGVYA